MLKLGENTFNGVEVRVEVQAQRENRIVGFIPDGAKFISPDHEDHYQPDAPLLVFRADASLVEVMMNVCDFMGIARPTTEEEADALSSKLRRKDPTDAEPALRADDQDHVFRPSRIAQTSIQ